MIRPYSTDFPGRPPVANTYASTSDSLGALSLPADLHLPGIMG